MNEEKCFRCERNKDEVKLLDAIYGKEIVKICEECSLIEDIPIIRRPSTKQLAESEKPLKVRERLRMMAGLEDPKEEISKISKSLMNVKLDNLRKPKDPREILEEKFSLAKKRNIPLSLVDNFDWLIMIERRKRKMDRKQLADAIGESETAIKMIENKEMPDDAFKIISKIEQYFNIKLKKETTNLQTQERKNRDMEPARILNLDKEAIEKLTIADLREMKEEQEKAEKLLSTSHESDNEIEIIEENFE